MYQILYLMGSFEIIGNPIGLFTNIASGLQDLITKPKEGFIKGPLEGGLGILEGAGSLLKNTSSGLFNSFNKITGSLGSGFVGLTLDEEYIRQRQLMKQQRARNVEQGFQQAGLTLLTGLEKGLTGLLTKPIEGAQKDGLEGLIKGTTQGILGFFVKPVTGILDAASKTAEGFKNQTYKYILYHSIILIQNILILKLLIYNFK